MQTTTSHQIAARGAEQITSAASDYRSIGCVRLLAAVQQRTQTILIPANRALGLAVGDETFTRGVGLCRVVEILGPIGVVRGEEPHTQARVEVLPALKLSLPGKP